MATTRTRKYKYQINSRGCGCGWLAAVGYKAETPNNLRIRLRYSSPPWESWRHPGGILPQLPSLMTEAKRPFTHEHTATPHLSVRLSYLALPSVHRRNVARTVLHHLIDYSMARARTPKTLTLLTM
jgi:hypothetical protein